MARRGVKMGLGDFLGDSAATYIPEAALPTAPRVRAEGEEDGGRGGYRRGGDRGYDRELSRSESSDQWRGDRGGYSDRGGDRFGDRRGDDRYGSRSGGDDNWRGSAGGPSRYDRPSRDAYAAEERPAHMRLNLQRRGESGDVRNAPASSSEDKFAGAFARRFGSAGGDDRRGGGDRYGDDRRGGDRYGDDRRGGDRFGGDRRGGYGDRYGDDRRDDRFSGGRFGRGDDRESSLSSGFNSLRVNDEPPAQQTSAPANEELDKKARAQKLREERKKKAEEERLAAEEAKRKAAEEKKAAEEAFAQRAAQDKAVIDEVLASGKLGDELVKVAKDVFAKAGRVPTGAVVIEAVTKKAENVAKASANWIAPTQYGPLLKLALADAPTNEQVKALYALQVFLNGHDFPKGVLEKCFMALYTLDILEEKAFFDYKYDVDSDVPGRMKAIVQTSTWLTWLETPEEESEEEDE